MAKKAKPAKPKKRRARRTAKAPITRLTKNRRKSVRRVVPGSGKAGRRKSPPAARAIKKKTARGSVNIKVNVLSRNPAKRRRPTPRPAPRLKRKDNRARFMIIANKQGGDRLYWTGVGGEFTDARHRAVLYTSFREASKKARGLISTGRLAPSVKSLQVKRY